MPLTQRLASWLALVALVVATPAAAYGRFECSFGMPQAGPACPLCHGEAGAPPDGPSIQGQCCEYVGAETAAAEMGLSSPQPVRSLVPRHALQAVPAGAPEAAPGPRAPSALTLDRAPRSGPPPHYLSNFLRL